VGIYPPGQHQLTGRVDRARAARRREAAGDLGNLAAADAQVGLKAAGLGDDQAVADEDFRRFLGEDRERPSQREEGGPHTAHPTTQIKGTAIPAPSPKDKTNNLVACTDWSLQGILRHVASAQQFMK
jgi:hypothetical protein